MRTSFGEAGMAGDLGDHVTFVMGECPKLHSRDINQEAIVSLILTALFTCDAFALTPTSRFGNHRNFRLHDHSADLIDGTHRH